MVTRSNVIGTKSIIQRRKDFLINSIYFSPLFSGVVGGGGRSNIVCHCSIAPS